MRYSPLTDQHLTPSTTLLSPPVPVTRWSSRAWKSGSAIATMLGVNSVHHLTIFQSLRTCSSPSTADVRSFQDVGGKDAIVLCLSDLSRQKRAEFLHIQTVEAQRAEAEKNRIQTEQYLDLSSHELRNRTSSPFRLSTSPFANHISCCSFERCRTLGFHSKQVFTCTDVLPAVAKR